MARSISFRQRLAHPRLGADEIVMHGHAFLGPIDPQIRLDRPRELPYFIDELNGPRRMEVVRDGLVARGYSAVDVEKIMGTNLYCLYEEVIG